MAGGKGSRLGWVEKGLIELGGTTILQRELVALKESDCMSDTYVAVTEYTPKTQHFAQTKGLKVVKTPGRGYVEDSREALKKLSLGVTLILCSDTPFLTGELVKKTVTEYYDKGKPSLSLAILKSSVLHHESKALDHSFFENGLQVLPAGINIIDGRVVSGNQMVDQAILVVNEPLVLLNVNTPGELELAQNLADAERSEK